VTPISAALFEAEGIDIGVPEDLESG